MYIQSEWRTECSREVYKRYTYPCRMENGKPVKCRRGRREKPTEEAQRRYNEKRKQRKLQRKINANFGKGDLYLTLTYQRGKRPKAGEEKKELRNFLRRLKREYRRQGRELKYVVTTEIGRRGAVHHHLIVPYMDVRVLEERWRKSGGFVHIQLIYSRDLNRLAGYLSKTETNAGRMSYSCSRNLVEPAERRKTVHARSWRENPVVPTGWALDKSTYEVGVNPFTGHGFQYYRLVRLDDPEPCPNAHRPRGKPRTKREET